MEVGVYVYLTSPKPFFGTSRFGVRCIRSSKWLSVETATANSFSKSHAAPRLIPLLCVCACHLYKIAGHAPPFRRQVSFKKMCCDAGSALHATPCRRFR